MENEQQENLKDRLDTLSRQIQMRISELREKGEFTSLREKAAKELRERHSALREKLDEAVGEGKMWEMLKDELELDLESLIESFRHWEEQLDTANRRSHN